MKELKPLQNKEKIKKADLNAIIKHEVQEILDWLDEIGKREK